MALTISEITLQQAEMLNAEAGQALAAGDSATAQQKLHQAYQVLAGAGDIYSFWGAQIVAPDIPIIGSFPNPMQDLVENIWEVQVPGSVAASFIDVAVQHQQQYLTLTRVDPTGSGDFNLPTTTEIEDSYRDALSDNGLPASLAVDLLINTAQLGTTGGAVIPNWDTVLLLEDEREGPVRNDLTADGFSPNQAAAILAAVGGVTTIEILNGYPVLPECFPSGTLITLADGTEKPIENIGHGDFVLTHDANGNPVPGIVTKLFSNTTSKFFRLSFTDNRDDLVTTPGHRFLTETGDYMEIGHMLRLGGGTARVVDLDGSVIEARGELIVYSAETAHLFPEAQTKTIAMQGNTVLKEQVEAGWQTYNFEVREHHNYVAGGVRVHNDSILSTLQAGDQLIALNDSLTDMAVIRDDQLVISDGYRLFPGLDTQVEVDLTFDLLPFQGDIEDVMSQIIAANPALASAPTAAVGANNDLIDAIIASGQFNPIPSAEYYGNPLTSAQIAVLLSGSEAAVTALFVSLINQYGTGSSVIDGTSGNDVLSGTSGNDEINGLEGRDTIDALAGDDTILGGDGNDVIDAGDGNDQIRGGINHDTITAGNGNDTVWGGNGRDVIYLGDGNDIFHDDAQSNINGRDSVHGGNGNDRLNGNGGNDALFGGAGKDTITGGIGNDSLTGGSGFDIALFSGNRTASGVTRDGDNSVSNNDRFRVTSDDGADRLKGLERLQYDDGRIALDIHGGWDAYDGRAGYVYRLYETVLGRNPDIGGLTSWVDLYDNTDSWTHITMANNFLGSQEFGTKYISFLDGSADTNSSFIHYLYDAAFGRSPDMTGFNNWTTRMNDGMTRAEVAARFAASAEMRNSVYDEVKDGIWLDSFPAGISTFRLEADPSSIFPGYTTDLQDLDSWFDVSTADIIAQHSAGYQRISEGTDGADRLTGGGKSDLIVGGDGNDTMTGGNGTDLLIGGDGNDVLRGQNGRDILNGGAGDNMLHGGGGKDTFIFAFDFKESNDVILDFKPGKDAIQIDWVTFSDLSIIDGDSGAVITYNDAETITLRGVAANMVSEDNFILAADTNLSEPDDPFFIL